MLINFFVFNCDNPHFFHKIVHLHFSLWEKGFYLILKKKKSGAGAFNFWITALTPQVPKSNMASDTCPYS